MWPVGYFLRAKLHFSQHQKNQSNLFGATKGRVQQILTKHHREVMTSVWRGIPELTNKNGAHCKDSCPTQAWSMGCILEVLYDLDKLIKETNAST